MSETMEVKGNTLTIRVPEELDHCSAEEIRLESDRLLIRNQIRQIVFDFSRTGFMDSSAIGMNMGKYRNIHLLGGTVKAVHVGGQVGRILRISGIHKVIQIEKDSAGRNEKGV
mgnify:FL=1